MSDIQQAISTAKQRMQKSIDAYTHELSRIRTGRAHPSLLDHIKVDYYGTETPLNQCASVVIEDARTLTITPWDKSLLPLIEKAVVAADMGLNPATQSELVRVPLPALTEERRKDLVRLVRQEAEGARVSVRNVRRDVLAEFKTWVKDKLIGEDDERRAQTDVQKLTDEFIAKVDSLTADKEKDVTTV